MVTLLAILTGGVGLICRPEPWVPSLVGSAGGGPTRVENIASEEELDILKQACDIKPQSGNYNEASTSSLKKINCNWPVLPFNNLDVGKLILAISFINAPNHTIRLSLEHPC